MTQTSSKPRGRDAQRMETRQRIYDAAVAEYRRTGMADADIAVIVQEAGVARGTFYFHFPTKEHVLAEVESNLVSRLAADLTRFLAAPRTLEATFDEVVRLVVAGESRLGARLFHDVLAMHFSATRPPEWGKATDHPLVALVAGEIARARTEALVHDDVQPVHSALYFLLGVYALLITNHEPKPVRARVIRDFVVHTLRGLAAR